MKVCQAAWIYGKQVQQFQIEARLKGPVLSKIPVTSPWPARTKWVVFVWAYFLVIFNTSVASFLEPVESNSAIEEVFGAANHGGWWLCGSGSAHCHRSPTGLWTWQCHQQQNSYNDKNRNNNNTTTTITATTQLSCRHQEVRQEIDCILEAHWAPLNAALASCIECIREQKERWHHTATTTDSLDHRQPPPHDDQSDDDDDDNHEEDLLLQCLQEQDLRMTTLDPTHADSSKVLPPASTPLDHVGNNDKGRDLCSRFPQLFPTCLHPHQPQLYKTFPRLIVVFLQLQQTPISPSPTPTRCHRLLHHQHGSPTSAVGRIWPSNVSATCIWNLSQHDNNNNTIAPFSP